MHLNLTTTTPPDDGAIKGLGEQHHKIIDWLLSNYTGKNLKHCAESFNVTQAWLSTVINSDIFKAEMRRRRLELNDAQTEHISQRAMEVAMRGLDVLEQKLNEDEVDPHLALNSVDKMLKNLGYGTKKEIGNQQNNFFLVENDVAQSARERIVNKAREAQPVLEAEVVASA